MSLKLPIFRNNHNHRWKGYHRQKGKWRLAAVEPRRNCMYYPFQLSKVYHTNIVLSRGAQSGVHRNTLTTAHTAEGHCFLFYRFL